MAQQSEPEIDGPVARGLGVISVVGGLVFFVVVFVLLACVSITYERGFVEGYTQGYVLSPFRNPPFHITMDYERAMTGVQIDVWASAGQQIVTNVDLKANAGRLVFSVYGPRGWWQRWFLADLSKPNPLGPLRALENFTGNTRGKRTIQVDESGYYYISLNPYVLTGHLEGTVDVR